MITFQHHSCRAPISYLKSYAIWPIYHFVMLPLNFNTLAAEFYLLPSNWHEDNLLHTFAWHVFYFSMLTVWQTFSLVLTFGRAENWNSALSTVQGKYTQFLKRRTRKFNFRSYVLNLVKINIRFHLSKIGNPGADLSTNHATIVNQACQFIGQTCHNSQIELADLSANHAN